MLLFNVVVVTIPLGIAEVSANVPEDEGNDIFALPPDVIIELPPTVTVPPEVRVVNDAGRVSLLIVVVVTTVPTGN